MRRLSLGLLALCLSFPPFAFAQHHNAHEHGIAQLRVAVDGRDVRVEFETPLDNLVGFEHAPRTQEERRALSQAERALREFDRLFVLPSAAGCAVKSVELASPWSQHKHRHDHAGDKDHKHGHDHEHGEAHADLHVVYELECAAPQALGAMEVRVMELFPRIHRVRAESATPRGQGSATLGASNRTLPL